MKTTAIAAFIGTFINVKFSFLPTPSLLLVMGVAIVLDLITGIIKAIYFERMRTSEGYRKTVIKFTQYGGAVVVGMLLKYISGQSSDMANIQPYVEYLTNGLVIFIIFIECTSVLENLYAIDQQTPFSKYFVGPLLKLLTFQIKNNPIVTMEKQHQANQKQNEAL